MSEMKRLLVTGSRDWIDEGLLISTMQYAQGILGAEFTLVSGACPTGADKMAEDWAFDNNVPIERHPADWNKYGRSAGPRRNKEMVNTPLNMCVAFILNESRGATHTKNLAVEKGIYTVVVVPGKGIEEYN